MTFDSLVNESEYFPSFYLDEILPKQLAGGRLKEWSALERQGQATPRQGLRDLTRAYIDARADLGPDAEKYHAVPDARAVAAQDAAAAALKALGGEDQAPEFQPAPGSPWAGDHTPEGVWRAGLAAWHDRVLTALGYAPGPGHFTARTPTGRLAVPVAHHEPGVVVLTGGFAQDLDATRGDGHANQLSAPVRVSAAKTLTTVTDLAAWLLAADNAPRYALLLFGGVMVLADRQHFSRGRYLAVSLDTALPRKAAKGASANEIDLVAALFAASSLRPGEDGSDDDIAKLVAESRDHSVGVTANLRTGLQKSVQLIANEVLTRAREEHGVEPEDLPEWLPDVLKEPGDLPRLLTTECLRYLYRILFLLYAEARPELNILPMKSDEYVTGYSVARLRDLVVQEKLSSGSRHGHHFHDSLSLLFEKVFTGHPEAGTVTSRDAIRQEQAPLPEDDGYEGVRIEALRSSLFDPKSIGLVGKLVAYPATERPDGSPAPAAPLDLRLRNKVLHQVLRHLTLVEGRGKGRGGFISYANLSINHLGAVYEGLMAYSGFIAREALYEVAKGGDAQGGSWLIRASQMASGQYPDDSGDSVFVKDRDPVSGEETSRVYPVGSYVYRLAGRDRQTSASYYTPESLTQATVEQTLRFRLDDNGEADPQDPDPEKTGITAAEVLRWRVCEPALGSGAFLNEAVNQLAELYLKLAQRERGKQIDPEEYQRELQKAKAYIALHNAYGVDLNRTAVELAEISLWLNTMYPGMRAPWYGLHLHRGNSLIGAARKVYPGRTLDKGGWLKASAPQTPRAVPLTEKLTETGVHRPVHQFLLPALGWGSVGDSVSVRKATGQSVVAGSVAEWLEPERIEAMRKWRAAMRRSPKGAPKNKGPKAAKSAAEARVDAHKAEERSGQGALDLGLEIWEQPGFDLSAPAAPVKPKKAAPPAPAPDTPDEGRYQTTRLRALAQRVEYLWDLVIQRLKLSEQEIARGIPVWGTEPDPSQQGPVMDRDAVLQALRVEGSPYWRLKQLMDAWCALWFWPLEEVGLLDGTDAVYFDGDRDLTKLPKGRRDRKVALKSLDEWIEFAEAVVGRVDVDAGEGEGPSSFFVVPKVTSLHELDTVEADLDAKMTESTGWLDALDLGDLFPWHGTAFRIAEERGFFHWELNLAHVFAEGGFDVMVGNPPWVKQEWKESGVLAEFEPWFELAEKPSNEAWAERKAAVLAGADARTAFMGELADSAAQSAFLSSVDTHPELVGTQPDLYRAFMLLVWRATGKRGAAGLIHPATHLTGANEGALRRATYRHLRLHADFTNELYLFAKPVMNDTHFSINIYGKDREVGFQHLAWLFHPSVLLGSLYHAGNGQLPAIKRWDKEKDKYIWDLRPHSERVTFVDRETLTKWNEITAGGESSAADDAQLLFPVTSSEQDAIAAIASWPHKIGDFTPRISRGFDEKNDRAAGYFSSEPLVTTNWNDVILQGSFIGVATPYAKQPPLGGSKSMRDYHPWNHEDLREDATPRTNYRRKADIDRFTAKQDHWFDRAIYAKLKNDETEWATAEDSVKELTPDISGEDLEEAILARLRTASRVPYSKFYRVAWREMNRAKNERVLQACLIPPGPTHIHAMRSMALDTAEETALVAGFFAAIPSEYLLRITNRAHMDVSDAKAFPAPQLDHPLAHALLLRTLRLNCQTTAYTPLWAELFKVSWEGEAWAAHSCWPPQLAELSEHVAPHWGRQTPLRADLARRAALVEIDALVAVWLGISADELVAMYRARFPVLQQYEENMWFDATGRRIAKAHQQHGYGQPKDAWKQLSSHEDFPEEAHVPEGYEGPLYRANRVKEMKAAHKEFTRRMRAAGWEPGDTEPPGTGGE